MEIDYKHNNYTSLRMSGRMKWMYIKVEGNPDNNKTNNNWLSVTTSMVKLRKRIIGFIGSNVEFKQTNKKMISSSQNE